MMNTQSRSHGTPKPDKVNDDLPVFDLRHVRAHFVRQGTSLNQWSKQRGYIFQSVRQALTGDRRGAYSRKLVRAVMRELSQGAA
jgi:hypothetical protein